MREQLSSTIQTEDRESEEQQAKRQKVKDFNEYDDDNDDQPVVDEIQQYLSCNTGPVTDLLAWWRDHQGQFPKLAQVARNTLCVQASSAPSERNFSVAGNVITKRRTALSSENVNAILFLNSCLN